MSRRKKSRKITVFDSVLLIIMGIIIGNVCIIGQGYWKKPITKDEALHVTATYSSFYESRRNRHTSSITVRFKDHEDISIERPLINKELREKIESLTPGTEISMVVHPNSNSILQMNIGTNELLEFDNSIKEYKSEIFKFMWLGLFGYAISIYGIINIILIYKKKYAGKSNNK